MVSIEQNQDQNLPSGSDPSQSLLDRVISSQQVASQESFHPTETVAALFRGLPPKEDEVLRRRFGLSGAEPETLEDIGTRFGVTRERIRQIQAGALSRIRRARGFAPGRGSLEQIVVGALTTAGGALEAEQLVRDLLGYGDDSPAHRRAVDFLLSQMLTDRIVFRGATPALKASWALVGTGDEATLALLRDVEAYFAQHSTPADTPTLLAAAPSFASVAADPGHYGNDVILAMLNRSRSIGTNPFGQWGLTRWGSIAPKRINDKIRLVLERAGEPLHFTEIAKRINEAQFDDRTAYAPTVHNELILNPEYVLVGRGLYALKAWGYREGVVADVVADVLRQAKRPLKRAEIVDAVLAQRFVKRNTVHLALSDRSRFARNGDGTYQLAEGRAT